MKFEYGTRAGSVTDTTYPAALEFSPRGGWKYVVNGPATGIAWNNPNGDLGVYIAASGTAGGAVTWTTHLLY